MRLDRRAARRARAAGRRCVIAENTTTLEERQPQPEPRRFLKHPTLGLLWNLTLREIRSQYKRTALGRLWSLLNPLATIAIFSIIFGFLFQAPPPEGENSGLHVYALWIACGIIPWTFISGSVQAAMSSLTSNSGLLTKVYFPRHVLVTSTVMSLVATFMVELLVVMIIMIIASMMVIGASGLMVLIYIPVLIGVLILTACFVLGIGFVLSVGVVYFRDIQHLWGIINQAWFYASGVVFPIAMVESAQNLLVQQGITFFGTPIPLVTLFKLNPAYHFLEAYRAVLYDFTLPGLDTWLIMLGWAAGALLIGVLVFRRFQGRIVEEL